MYRNLIKYIEFIFLASVFICNNNFCADIGSDTAVNRFNTQQTLNDGDRIAGFAALQGGFKLANSSVNGIFDSFFPVSGDVDFFGGYLHLRRDLVFASITSWNTLGSIIGNDYRMELPTTFIGKTVQLIDSIAGVWGISVSCNWAYDGSFIATALDRWGESDTWEFDGTTITFRDDDYSVETVQAYDVVWHPSQYWIAKVRQERSAVGPGGEEVQTLSVNPATGVQTRLSGFSLGVNAYAVDWHPTGNWIAVARNNASAEIAVYSVNGSGILNSTAVSTYNTDAGVRPRSIEWSVDGDFLAIGLEATAANELVVLSFNQTTSTLSTGTTFLVGSAVNAVSWSQVPSEYLAIGLEGTSGELFRIYEFDSGAITLTQRASKSDLDQPVLTIDWNPILSYVCLGRAQGSGAEFRTYYFSELGYILEEVASEDLNADVLSLAWSNDGRYVAVTDNIPTLGYLSVYSLTAGWGLDSAFSDIHIFLSEGFELDNIITFTGIVSSVHGASLVQLGAEGGVLVDDCILTLKDLRISGVNGTNLRCTTTSSVLILDNVELIQSGDFDFSAGQLEILNTVLITGEGYGFSYSSDKEMTINSASNLIIDAGMTFSYKPPIADRDLLRMVDSTSDFTLRGGTLFSTSTGLRLTKGNLVVERKSFIFGEGTVLPEAISFGDGVSAANNVTIQYVGAANLDILGGYVVDNTVSS